MENISQSEIILASSDSTISSSISRALAGGKLRKLAPRLYTSNLTDEPEEIVLRNRYFILGKLFPGAVISHRSALEGGVSKEGLIVLSYKYTKLVKLPGLTVHLLKSAGVYENDMPFVNNLYIASRPRAFLENMQSSRGPINQRKSLPVEEVEKRLEKIINIYGVDEINKIKDEARKISTKLILTKEFKKLEKLISALLGTQNAGILKSEQGKARSKGFPYDNYRVELFAVLAAKLQSGSYPAFTFNYDDRESFKNLCFFEAYFSNFIEGTEFEVGEAADIIFHQKILDNRPADSHDILGTYKIISSLGEMKKQIEDSNTLVEILKSRHRVLMEGRPEKSPGAFKHVDNRVGDTVFVSPENVLGTFKKGFELYQCLTSGFPKAVFMMFFISEVHPFLDGNGRIARIMMNAELTRFGSSRIIIPTVYREDYLLSLRRLSKEADPDAYIKMILRAYEFSRRINFSNYDDAMTVLKNCNAFMLSHQGKLLMPAKDY